MKFLTYLFVFSSLSLIGNNLLASDTLHPATKIVRNIRHEAACKLMERYPLKCIGEGASMPGGVVESIHLTFDIYEPPTKEEARKLIVESSQDFLQMINSHHELAEYAPVFPFTHKNIELTIFIKDQKGRSSMYPNLSIIRVLGGKVQFWTHKEDPPHVTGCDLYKTEEENYDEALKIVRPQPKN